MNPKRIFVLFLMLNIVNYLDRNVTSGVLPLLKADFQVNDAMIGLLGTAFMITYSIAAIPFGIWSDRWNPYKVAAIGTLIWSLATICSAFAWSFSSLYLFRALVGIGEAAFVTTGSTILSNLFPQNKRARILGLFNLGLPIGSALGVTLGGAIGGQLGWQWAFLIVGLPGLVLAYFTWKLPQQGVRQAVRTKTTDVTSEETKELATEVTVGAAVKQTFNKKDIFELFSNAPFMLAALGYAGISFAFGAIAYFGTSLFHREFGYSVEFSGTLAGVMIVAAGLLGAPLGGILADMWMKRSPRGRIYTVSIAMLLSALFLAIGLSTLNLFMLYVSIFFMMWHVGIASSIIFDVSSRHIWNTAQALALFIMHVLGDVFSTAIIGYISDRTGLLQAIKLLSIPMLFAAVMFFAIIFFVPSRKNDQPA
ncbi:spinster family MFS transporter [Paenibacillus eucommiae]|uniref:MFS family arabinose efflux permease n=1 Tax=Paenibacillus eucommiae TaxID=1355755 RepID=A0ABS4J6Y5_9BACL|nr:MFS transporter [Paenibacillus eucommiae]MBP1995600.1 putative MFS family arabinose efflux permease [Paenibacillus eucommiae]